MSDPWLSIIGMGEDGLNGLTPASLEALASADVVFGGPRHLTLAGVDAGRAREWPVPFSTAPVLALRGQNVAVLASGDPFWFGAGGSLVRDLAPGEWRTFPGVSTFSHLAAALGWRLEEVTCLGLHAAPVAEMRSRLHYGHRLILLVADAAQSRKIADYLTASGYGASTFWIGECMGGPKQRLRRQIASSPMPDDIVNPVAIAIDCSGPPGLPRSSGLPDDLFLNDGQITKRPIRALALSALAPRPRQHLWDIGGGSGSISVEWCLAGGTAHAIEPRSERAARILANAAAFGVAKSLQVVQGSAPAALANLSPPDAVFVGGGASASLVEELWAKIPLGCRLVAHSVTLETESLLAQWQARVGGDMMRVEIAEATPLGRMRGWTASRPVVQWSVVR